jgi:catalase
MTPSAADPNVELARQALEIFDAINGSHPGFRPAHAKGILLEGLFTPSVEAGTLTRAPHIQRESTPVTVRFSDASGIPAIPDNDPNASPRGMAIRFHLAEHVHTDIISHTVDGFPVRTPQEFLEFLDAVSRSGPGTPHPTPIEQFLGGHPPALDFVRTPKPMPASFVKAVFHPVLTFRFINSQGASRYGRYRIQPEGEPEYPGQSFESNASPNLLFDEIRGRIANGSAKMRIFVKLAEKDDEVNDSTAHWPQDRQEIAFGTIELRSVTPDNAEQQRHIIFDPIPRVEGIEPSDDPLFDFRAALYLMSGRRRRTNP